MRSQSQLNLLRLWLSFFCRSLINALASDSKKQIRKGLHDTIQNLQSIWRFHIADYIEHRYRYQWFPFLFEADLQGRSCWQWGLVLPFQGCDKHPASFLGAEGEICVIYLIQNNNNNNKKHCGLKKKNGINKRYFRISTISWDFPHENKIKK